MDDVLGMMWEEGCGIEWVSAGGLERLEEQRDGEERSGEYWV